MKILKIFISLVALILILGPLIYKNIIAPEDETSPLSQLSHFTLPLFMLLSFVLYSLKRKEENKGKKKLTQEDRELFKSIGNSNDSKSDES